jgi:SAM-dependent methyltransferase
MLIDGLEVVVDNVTKFFDSVYISGWSSQILQKVAITGIPDTLQVSSVGLLHEGVSPTLGPSKGFRLQALLLDGWREDLNMEVMTSRGRSHEVSLSALAKDRIDRYKSIKMFSDFSELIRSKPGARVLDIGGRNRSGVDRSNFFQNVEYIVLDVLPGENVDVVCDAHEMSTVFAPESFDYIVSYSVFEHLLMPWKVAIEMNRVLKPRGKALVSTHQTLGLHDAPWDFWRFSADSWDALFNKRTGFKVLDRVQDYEQFILPFVARDGKLDAEKAAGFEASLVVAEKVSRPTVGWEVSLPEIIDTSYVSGVDTAASAPFDLPWLK